MLAERLAIRFKDQNITMGYGIGPLPFEVRTWAIDVHEHATTMAVCSGTTIAGSKEGLVVFIPETGDYQDQEKEQRIRQVGNPEYDSRNILDVGCLGHMAYTVSIDAGHGQIQLWDLETKAASHWVGIDSGGHPGMAFVAVGSKSGDQLLSLGDLDVRLWAVKNGQLKLVAKHFVSGSAQSQAFAAAALDSGDFIYWDGARIWKYPGNGGDPTLYAGKKTN
jgi:hypothetical protein